MMTTTTSKPKRITKVERAAAATMADRDLVVACLHYSGAYYGRLLRGADLGARLLCDGFGRLSSAELDTLGVTYDWSHVRDSSPAAIASTASYLRQVLRVARTAGAAS